MQKEDEDTKDHFDHFKNHVEVMENNGDELGTEEESLKQNETSANHQKLNNKMKTTSKQQKKGQEKNPQFTVHVLAVMKKDLTISVMIQKTIALLVIIDVQPCNKRLMVQ